MILIIKISNKFFKKTFNNKNTIKELKQKNKQLLLHFIITLIFCINCRFSEIKKYQCTSELLILKTSFARLIREITSEIFNQFR